MASVTVLHFRYRSFLHKNQLLNIFSRQRPIFYRGEGIIGIVFIYLSLLLYIRVHFPLNYIYFLSLISSSLASSFSWLLFAFCFFCFFLLIFIYLFIFVSFVDWSKCLFFPLIKMLHFAARQSSSIIDLSFASRKHELMIIFELFCTMLPAR